tara:strand:+ start:665 stop:1750 length:1086 start_codon:yes stop_codon:yes gene_type:complete
MNYKGKIKSIRETFNGKLSSVTKFDESGNIIEIDSWSHMRNRAYRKYIKNYQDNNCITKYTHYDRENDIYQKGCFVTDKNDNVIYRLIKNKEGKKIIESEFIFKHNKIVQEKHLDKNIDYNYNNEKKLLSKISTDNNGNTIESIFWEYTEFGKVKSKKFYNAKNELFKYTIHEYNKNNKKIKKFNYAREMKFSPVPNEKSERAMRRFEEIEKNMVHFNQDAFGKNLDFKFHIDYFKSQTNYFYDSRGNLVTKVKLRYRPDFIETELTESLVRTFKYDEKNKLIYESEMIVRTDWDDFTEFDYTKDKSYQEKIKKFDSYGNLIYEKEGIIEKTFDIEYYSEKPAPNNGYNSLWQRVKSKFNL